MTDQTPTLVDRVIFAIWGALIAAFTAAGILLWFLDGPALDFVAFAAVGGGLVGFALGREGVEWLKGAFARVWW